MKFKPYLAETRMSARLSLGSGWTWVAGSYVLRLMRVGFLLLMWRSLFQRGGSLEMTLVQTLQYTLCSAALEPLLDVRTPAGDWLHGGAYLSRCMRPMSILGQLAADALGAALIPLAVFVPLCAGLGWLMDVPLLPQSAWFLPSLLLCMTQGFAIDMCFVCIIIRVGNLSWQVHMLRSAITTLLTGGLIPFAALPWNMGAWLRLSPFGTLAGAPLSLYAGLAQPLEVLPVQLWWNLILWPLCLLWLKKSQERLVSFGG